MNRSLTYIISLGVIASTLVFVGCDWSSGGDSNFNTSRTNLDVNISGVYRGNADGKAVTNPSAGNITQLVVQQSGNVLEVTDNQGSTYRGSVGIPTTLGDADGVIPLGSELAAYTVSWAGTDNASGRDVQFTGAIDLVAVDDISGDAITETVTTTDDNVQTDTQTSSTSSDNTLVSNNSAVNNTSDTGDNQDTTTVDTSVENSQGQGGTQTGNAGETETDLTSTTVNTTRQTVSTSGSVFENTNNNTTDNTTTTTDVSGTDSTDTRTTGTASTREVVTANNFVLTGNNVQMRLRGSWIEEGGTISSVDGVSAGSGGIFVIPVAQDQDTTGL